MLTPHSMRAVFKKEALHFTVGTAIGLILFFLPRFWALLFLAVATLVMVVFEVVRLTIPALNRKLATWLPFIIRKKEEAKGVTGSTYFLIGSLLTAVVFPKYIAVPAILFAALGDPAATVIGTWIGKTKLWGKSLEGNLACLVVCLIISIIFANFFIELSLITAVVGAVVATLFQALDLPVNDNLTIAPGSAIVMAGIRFLVIP